MLLAIIRVLDCYETGRVDSTSSCAAGCYEAGYWSEVPHYVLHTGFPSHHVRLQLLGWVLGTDPTRASVCFVRRRRG